MTQAEYVRVPIADVNLLKISPKLPEKQAILLADIVRNCPYYCNSSMNGFCFEGLHRMACQ
jgi:threonine dehydrogenase-like Zn-dependent dehydrogenase